MKSVWMGCTENTLPMVRSILKKNDDTTHLKNLLLELLEGSPVVKSLVTEMNFLLLNSETRRDMRILAQKNLMSLDEYDHQADFDALQIEKSANSLMLAAVIVGEKGVETFGQEAVYSLLQSIDEVYFSILRKNDREEVSRYFIISLIQSFNGNIITWLLDRLSDGLKCCCDAKYNDDCHCREGRSHMIGLLLDRLFEEAEIQPTAAQLWLWTKELNFKRSLSGKESIAVKSLQKNNVLRRSVQRLALANLSDGVAIFKMRMIFFPSEAHSGIMFYDGDIQAITEDAFKSDNVLLWSYFIDEPHRLYQKKF